MDKHYFIKLLHKYQEGDLTKEEQDFFESYYSLFQNEPDIFDLLSSEEKNDIKVNIWNNISKEDQLTPKIRFKNKRLINVVAAAAIFIGITSGLFIFYNSPSKKHIANITVLQVDGKSKKQIYTTLEVHQKENRAILLSDGSTVILSPGSKFNYPSSFDGMDKREVFLVGQAYFDIKHYTIKPFIVHTGKLETIDLGTAFNIRAISGENDIVITVKRGKVKVSDQEKIMEIMNRNQQITYNKKKVSSTLKFVNTDSYMDWKNRDLFIDNLTLSEAAKLLEEHYKVRIVISDPSIREQRFTGTFAKDESFEEAIKSISVFNGVVYRYNKKTSLVIINTNN